jgi:hypothetical protein
LDSGNGGAIITKAATSKILSLAGAEQSMTNLDFLTAEVFLTGAIAKDRKERKKKKDKTDFLHCQVFSNHRSYVDLMSGCDQIPAPMRYD